MSVLYELAWEDNFQASEWLKEIVVLLDFVFNFDGYVCYIDWYWWVVFVINMFEWVIFEYQELWLGGRVNYYYFDFNWDWAW